MIGKNYRNRVMQQGVGILGIIVHDNIDTLMPGQGQDGFYVRTATGYIGHISRTGGVDVEFTVFGILGYRVPSQGFEKHLPCSPAFPRVIGEALLLFFRIGLGRQTLALNPLAYVLGYPNLSTPKITARGQITFFKIPLDRALGAVETLRQLFFIRTTNYVLLVSRNNNEQISKKYGNQNRKGKKSPKKIDTVSQANTSVD